MWCQTSPGAFRSKTHLLPRCALSRTGSCKNICVPANCRIRCRWSAGLRNISYTISWSGINKNLGGNILTYNESEDAYYIQYGADSAPKKLGNGKINIPIMDFLVSTSAQALGASTMGFDISEYTDLSFTISKDHYNGYTVVVSTAENYSDISSSNCTTVVSRTARGAGSDTVTNYDISNYNWLKITGHSDSTSTKIKISNLIIE